jgi:hypothetical protein
MTCLEISGLDGVKSTVSEGKGHPRGDPERKRPSAGICKAQI